MRGRPCRRIAFHSELPGVIEVRRAEGGIRTWAAEPGEYHHSFTGEYGGLWRRQGRPPNLLGGVGFTGRFGGLYPIYVRGLAYLAGHRSAEAAGEFQRILDHRSLVLVDPMDAMARLLARALTLAGDVPRAKRAYDDFLTLGKTADADIPLFGEARVEYTRLP